MAAAEPSSRRNSTIGCSQMVRLVSSPGTRSSAHMATYQALRRNGIAASVPPLTSPGELARPSLANRMASRYQGWTVPFQRRN